MIEQKTKRKVVIVGGGFGGVKTALELASHQQFDITLVSDRANFFYYPTLYHTATGGAREQSVIPLEHLFASKPINFIQAHVETIDRTTKQLTLADGQTIPYDSLVLALGVLTNYFGIPGLPEYSFGIKSIDEAEALKAHLHKQLIEERKPDLNYVIVGGGPTGIELAGNLGAYVHEILQKHGLRDRPLHIDLIEANKQLMPRMPKPVGRAIARRLRRLGVKLYLGKTVQGQTAEALTVDGKPIRSHTVVWTAGVANNPFFTTNNFKITEHRKVWVDEFLRTEPDIYVIGDNADTKYSGMAQTAIYDAEFIAHNLVKDSEDKPKLAYRPKKPVYVTPAGHHWAAVEWGNFHIYGWLGWFLREAGDFVAFTDIEPLPAAAFQWAHIFDQQHLCDTCGHATTKTLKV